MPGETGAALKDLTPPIAAVIGGCFAIAVYNSFEIYISIFRTFRRRRGLYFGSAICADTGIVINSLFVLLRYLITAPAGPMSIGRSIGWWLMVNGQSLMLYSRLHLVADDPKRLRWLLWMIVGSFLLIQIPVPVLFSVISFKYKSNNKTTSVFDAIVITELVVIGLQECVLSGYWVCIARKTLEPMKITKGNSRVRKAIWELVALFILVLVLDISVVVVQATNYYLVYSIKLKVEILVLNNVVAPVSPLGCNCQHLENRSPQLNTLPPDPIDESWRAQLSSAGVSDAVSRRRASRCVGNGTGPADVDRWERPIMSGPGSPGNLEFMTSPAAVL
ncbi:hypothetical protein F4808DRAFT_467699 [Astrocystis sublimbata]|nr:hypothetical protein F4808DRAFT_467699 [Astrocystis sublimbata]